MLDLKSCPFCGGEATHRRFTGNGFTLARVEYTQVSCQKCRIETEPDQPLGNEDRAATAWNRRTLQAVGPEPTVAVKPLEWEGDFAHTRFGLFYHVNHATGTPGYVVLEKHEGSATSKSSWDTVADAQVAAEADYASRIRSALVATPPAERVVETDWINYRPLAEGEIIQDGDECLTDSHLGWQPAANTVGSAAPDPSYTAHRMYRRPLATKPAVKDDETVVEALRGATASLVAAVSLLKRGSKKAAPSDKMFDQMILDYEKSIKEARAALAAKDGRS